MKFSTGPCAPATHWKQTVFLLNPPVEVSEGMHRSPILPSSYNYVFNACTGVAQFLPLIHIALRRSPNVYFQVNLDVFPTMRHIIECLHLH